MNIVQTTNPMREARKVSVTITEYHSVTVSNAFFFSAEKSEPSSQWIREYVQLFPPVLAHTRRKMICHRVADFFPHLRCFFSAAQHFPRGPVRRSSRAGHGTPNAIYFSVAQSAGASRICHDSENLPQQ